MTEADGPARLERIWAGWRGEYVAGSSAQVSSGNGTVFERILASGLSDEASFVLWRGEYCAAILNVYPYGTGHAMVMPKRAVAALGDLEVAEYRELWDGVASLVNAIESAYSPDGMNVGLNIGRAGGASIPDHIHVHCLPRWAGDTTFMTSVASARMLPEALPVTWAKLRNAWPVATDG